MMSLWLLFAVCISQMCHGVKIPDAPIGAWFSDTVNTSNIYFNIVVPNNYTSVRMRLLSPESTSQHISVFIQNVGLHNDLFALYSYGSNVVSTGSTNPGVIPGGNYTIAIVPSQTCNFTLFISMDDIRLPSNATCDLRWTSACSVSIDSMYASGAVMKIDNYGMDQPIGLYFYPSSYRDANDPYQPLSSGVPITVYISLDRYPDPQHQIYDAKINSDATGMIHLQIDALSSPLLSNGSYNIIMTEKAADSNCSTMRYYNVGYCRGKDCSVEDPNGYTLYTTTNAGAVVSGTRTSTQFEYFALFNLLLLVFVYII